MGRKILISILIFNLSTAVYAIEQPVTALSKTNSFPKNSIKASNATDPFQYCFTKTTWVVPPQTLLSYLYSNGVNTAASDQTVWVIPTSSYNQGYFSGEAYTSIDNSILSQKHLIGSVTSAGKVYITFYSGASTSTDLVSGIGDLKVNSAGQCYFTMQMNSGQNGVSGLIHWSYMIPVIPGDPFYSNLPGTQMSVPQFLAQF